MNLKEIEGKIFDTYTESVRRFRAILLSAILAAGLMLVHVYLDYSWSERQLETYAAWRAEENKTALLTQQANILQPAALYWRWQDWKRHHAEKSGIDRTKSDEPLKIANQKIEEQRKKCLDAYFAADDPFLLENLRPSVLLKDRAEFRRQNTLYAVGHLRDARTEKTLDDRKLPERTLPILNLAVPGNDFLLVVQLLLILLLLTLWFTCRSIHAPVQALLDETYADEPVAAVEQNVHAVAAVEQNVHAVAAVEQNVHAVAAVEQNVHAVAAVEQNVHAVSDPIRREAALRNLLRLHFVFTGTLEVDASGAPTGNRRDRTGDLAVILLPLVPLLLALFAILWSEIAMRGDMRSGGYYGDTMRANTQSILTGLEFLAVAALSALSVDELRRVAARLRGESVVPVDLPAAPPN